MATDKLCSESCDVLPFTIYGQAVPRVCKGNNLAVGGTNPLARPLGALRMNTAVPGAVDSEQWTSYLWQHSPHAQNQLQEFVCCVHGFVVIAPDPRFR